MTQPVTLVTGGAGFIGRHLVRQLAERGARVRVLDLQDARDLGDGVECVVGSICDRAAVARAMDGAQTVYHLAANPDLWAARRETFAETNLEGTRTMLAVAAERQVKRFVYTSTESILKGRRATVDGAPQQETVTLSIDDMMGPYTRSKFLAEEAATAAARDGLPVVIVNPTLPIGPGDRRITPPTRMILDFLNGANPAYLECELNMIDVRDVAAGHILAAERGRAGERYILGNENVRLSDLLKLLHELTGLSMPRIRIPYFVAISAAVVSEFIADHVTGKPPRAPTTGVRLCRTPMIFDSSKAVRELGLPQTPIRTAIADAVAWLQGQGLLTRTPRLAA
ncbi:MAG: hopanoid-associated sugar epimerase [Rhodospirillales bacterium]